MRECLGVYWAGYWGIGLASDSEMSLGNRMGLMGHTRLRGIEVRDFRCTFGYFS